MTLPASIGCLYVQLLCHLLSADGTGQVVHILAHSPNSTYLHPLTVASSLYVINFVL